MNGTRNKHTAYTQETRKFAEQTPLLCLLVCECVELSKFFALRNHTRNISGTFLQNKITNLQRNQSISKHTISSLRTDYTQILKLCTLEAVKIGFS